MKPINSKPEGFTLIELIIVLAGLGVLSSLAISNVGKYLDHTRVDEAKSLLNSAVADCLQELRRKGSNRLNQEVNQDILSAEQLEGAGYKFQDTSTTMNCGNTLITAISSADQERMPDLGFTITAEGKLTKLAVDTGRDTASSAKSWAGRNVTEAAGLKELMDYNKEILEKKTECVDNFNKWLKNTGDGRSFTWDNSANSGCPSRPPKAVSKTCTTNGCTKPVYALDNSIVGHTQEAYDAAFKAKYDALCSQEVVAKRTANSRTTSEDGEKLANCGQKKFWFFDGENVGSSDAWKALMCKSNKQKIINSIHSEPVKYCGDSPIYICGGKEILGANAKSNFEKCLVNDKNAICTTALNNDAVKRPNGGEYISPTPAGMSSPVGDDCNISYWYCSNSGKIYRGADSEQQYKSDPKCKRSCGPPPQGRCVHKFGWEISGCIEWKKCMEGI
mgnify:CR=1 FL=1|tara:strand:- start:13258 stop:14598 length:1341 start_codon:yes stop_codon:yes gene_type:complete